MANQRVSGSYSFSDMESLEEVLADITKLAREAGVPQSSIITALEMRAMSVAEGE